MAEMKDKILALYKPETWTKKNKDFPNMTFRDRGTTKITVYNYTGEAPIDSRVRGQMFFLAIHCMYDIKWEKQSNPCLPETLSSLITTLLVYVDYDTLKDAGFEESLKKCNISLDMINFTDHDKVNSKFNEIWNKMEMKPTNCATDYQVFEVCALSLFIFLRDKANDSYNINWDSRHNSNWSTIANVLSVKMDPWNVKKPTKFACDSLYAVASANQPLRVFFFKVIRSLSNAHENVMSCIFQKIVEFLQWTKMGHIQKMIENISLNTPNNNIRVPNHFEKQAFIAAMELLQQYPKEDLPFVQLLSDSDNLQVLDPNKFPSWMQYAD